MPIRIKKINNVIVKPPPDLLNKKDKRLAKAHMLFPKPFCNIFIASRKESGKSVAINHILRSCISKNTIVHFFVSTLYNDDTYISMMNMLDRFGVQHIDHLSIIEDSVDHVDEIVEALEKIAKNEHEKKNTDNEPEKKSLLDIFNGDDVEKEKGPRRSKYISPDHVFIFDDLSGELNESVTKLLKKNRHFKCITLISSQSFNDLESSARNQIDYLLIFKELTRAKLNEIHKSFNTNINIEKFIDIYKYATQDDYCFLYIDRRGTFRKNFDTLIEIN